MCNYIKRPHKTWQRWLVSHPRQQHLVLSMWDDDKDDAVIKKLKKTLYTPCISLSWGTDALIHTPKHTSPSCNEWLSCTCHYLSISSWLLCRVHPKIMNNSFVCTVSFSHSGDFSVLMNENASSQIHSKGWQKKKKYKKITSEWLGSTKEAFFLATTSPLALPSVLLFCAPQSLTAAGVYFTCVNWNHMYGSWQLDCFGCCCKMKTKM